MFLTFCYYFASSSLIASACFGTYYYFDKEGATRLAFNVSWQGVNCYVKAKSYLDRFSDVFSSNAEEENEEEGEEEEDKNISNKKFMFYHLQEKSTIIVDELTDEMVTLLQDHSGAYIQFLCYDDNKFCRITDSLTQDTTKEDFQFTKIDKPFIQVELEQNNKTFEIHKFLKEHYFEGNKILDKEFLQWYLPYYSLGTLADEYTLKIIDKNIEMFTMNENQYILLSGGGYKCETI